VRITPAGQQSTKSNTLYVASTGDNAIYAIRGAGTTRVNRGTGRVVYQDSTHLQGPLGMTMAPDGNPIASQGETVNSDPKQPSELVEFITKGKFIGQFSISTEQGGAFGVATSSTRRQRHHQRGPDLDGQAVIAAGISKKCLRYGAPKVQAGEPRLLSARPLR
jgi:hypothetical protein